MKVAAVIIPALLVLASASEACADPPPWAPAHGYRSDGRAKGKNRGGERYYVGFSGREYERDFGVVRGRCDREQIGAVLGGVVGGVVGNQAADRGDRTVATILGAAVGALIGASIGRGMDDRDRACMGQALELGTSGRRVAWTNESNGVRFELVPADGRRVEGRPACREFTLVTVAGGERRSSDGRACQSRPGVWDLASG
jgi:surface antigen